MSAATDGSFAKRPFNPKNPIIPKVPIPPKIKTNNCMYTHTNTHTENTTINTYFVLQNIHWPPKTRNFNKKKLLRSFLIYFYRLSVPLAGIADNDIDALGVQYAQSSVALLTIYSIIY